MILVHWNLYSKAYAYKYLQPFYYLSIKHRAAIQLFPPHRLSKNANYRLAYEWEIFEWRFLNNAISEQPN